MINDASTHWFRLLVGLSLAVGIVFRFTNLDHKVYWYDETFTSLRISGYLGREVRAELATQQPFSLATLYKYQHVNPDRTVYHTLTTIILDDPHHGPLYYILARLWAGWVGDTVFWLRLFTALTSLLAFPCLYWLCIELFGSRLIAWTALSLLSLSSFQIIYAQEAREYALGTGLTLLASACLLYALRTQTRTAWGLYTATAVLAWYSHTLFGLVFVAHAVFVVLDWYVTPAPLRPPWRRALGAYLVSAGLCLFLYLPWVWVAVVGRNVINAGLEWTTVGRSYLLLISRWGHGLTTVFLDPLGIMELLGQNNEFIQPADMRISWPLVVLAGGVSALILYAGYYLWRVASRRSALFILTMAALPFAGLAVPDLVLGGIRSTVLRYHTAGIIAVTLAVAFVLGHRLAHGHKPRVALAILAALLVGAGVANYGIAGSAVWWNKGGSYHIPSVVRTLTQVPSPLLVAPLQSRALADLYSMLHPVPADYRVYLARDTDPLVLPTGLREFYVYTPTAVLRQKLTDQGYTLTPSPTQPLLFVARQ